MLVAKTDVIFRYPIDHWYFSFNAPNLAVFIANPVKHGPLIWFNVVPFVSTGTLILLAPGNAKENTQPRST